MRVIKGMKPTSFGITFPRSPADLDPFRGRLSPAMPIPRSSLAVRHDLPDPTRSGEVRDRGKLPACASLTTSIVPDLLVTVKREAHVCLVSAPTIRLTTLTTATAAATTISTRTTSLCIITLSYGTVIVDLRRNHRVYGVGLVFFKNAK